MFDLRQRKNGNPLLIAHRGAMAHAPGNSMPAFDIALRDGADMIELDVQLTADGDVLIFHDFSLRSVTDAPGGVRDHSTEFLRSLDLSRGTWADGPLQMPFLHEVLAWAKGRMPLMIELKHEPVVADDLEEKTLALVRDFGMEDEVVMISFDQFALQKMKQLAPEITTSFIYIGRVLDPAQLVSGLDVDALSPATNMMDEGDVKRIQAAGYACSPGGLWWDFPLLKQWGVDTVSSSDPATVSFE